MAELEPQSTDASVDDFATAVEDERKREDWRTHVQMMRRVTGAEPVMWGPLIVDCGKYR